MVNTIPELLTPREKEASKFILIKKSRRETTGFFYVKIGVLSTSTEDL
jgi:hypothetical protein